MWKAQAKAKARKQGGAQGAGSSDVSDSQVMSAERESAPVLH